MFKKIINYITQFFRVTHRIPMNANVELKGMEWKGTLI